jgi:hypothetical protein
MNFVSASYKLYLQTLCNLFLSEYVQQFFFFFFFFLQDMII